MSECLEWYEPARDPAVIQLAKSIVQRARWALPDVLIAHDQLLPEIARVIPLFQERIDRLAQEATRVTGSQVELVVAGVTIAQTDAFHVPTAGPSDLEETRSSRAHAARIALARQVLEAAARVETTTDIHRHEVDALRKAAIDAVQYLNVTFQQNHRFADRFTFVLPTSLSIDETAYDIGLTRVHDALNSKSNEQTHEEGAA